MNNLEKFSILVNGLDHPEGVAWGRDGSVYAGGEAGQLYRVAIDGGAFEQVGTTGGFMLGLALDGSGNIYGCDSARQEVVKIRLSDGLVSSYSKGSSDAPARTPNWPVFRRDGSLFFSDSGEWANDDGLVFLVAPNGETRVWSRLPRRFTNGLALDAPEEYLYVVESQLPGISRIKINEDGSAGTYEVFTLLEGTVPDGIAFCQDGTLLVGCYAPSRIYRITDDGIAANFAEDPQQVLLAAPCNLAFAGELLDRLVVSGLGRWHLAHAKVGLSGMPLNYPLLE